MNPSTVRHGKPEKQARRTLRFLAFGKVKGTAAAHSDCVLLTNMDGVTISAWKDILRRMESAELIANNGQTPRMIDSGRNHLRRTTACEEPFSRQHSVIAADHTTGTDGSERPVAINFSESPLAMLTKMKTRSGVLFLEHGEFHAGERPRADFDRGGLQPRVGVDTGTIRRAGLVGVHAAAKPICGMRRCPPVSGANARRSEVTSIRRPFPLPRRPRFECA